MAHPTPACRLVLGAAAIAAAATVSAAGTSLAIGGSQGDRLAAGISSVATCQAAAFTVGSPVVTATGQVTQITVGNIQGSCTGSTVHLSLMDAANAALGSGLATVPVGGSTTSATIPLSPAAPRASVARYVVVVVGP